VANRQVRGDDHGLLLASPTIPPGGEIPSLYTCDGTGISPPLTWRGLPDGTESLVLGVEYPDAGGFHEARNDLRKAGHGGPYPPKGHRRHRYHFHLLAISRPTLDLKPTATAADVLRTAQPYAIQRAELVGTYHR
jgi:phosphatidylethanolamine-binding protein (PEBP) family uncharacterized protein